MRHFLVVGEAGETAGVVNEIIQGYKDLSSAHDLQDYYSNELGADFFDNYYDEDSDQNFGQQLENYFNDRAALNEDKPKK